MTTDLPTHAAAGDPAPWFKAPTDPGGKATLAFDELAGRPIVLICVESAADARIAADLAALRRRTDLFNQNAALLVVLSGDPEDFRLRGMAPQHAAEKFAWDATGRILQAFTGREPGTGGHAAPPQAILIDPDLRVVDSSPLSDAGRFASDVEDWLARRGGMPDVQAPVLQVPGVFEGELCASLIAAYDRDGGREIGAVEQDGKVVRGFDPFFRKRRDFYVGDQPTQDALRIRLQRRLLPHISRVFQFNVTRIERYLVGCYDAQSGGHFRPHRDNTDPVVAHRRFALTINLNAGYEGGDLRFPEYGQRSYRPAPGGAIVFSCSLLHEVTPVTSGRRYAFITFLYDEAAQAIRERNAEMARAAS